MLLCSFGLNLVLFVFPFLCAHLLTVQESFGPDGGGEARARDKDEEDGDGNGAGV